MPLIDLTGHVFGRLTVLRRGHTDGNRDLHWLCRCSCGSETAPTGKSLRGGNTRSCGCLHGDMLSIRAHKARARAHRPINRFAPVGGIDADFDA